MPHFHHLSIRNQNQSMSNLVIFNQTSKAIALLIGQTCLILITFQSAIKINQCQIWSFFTKLPRLYPYFSAKNASFSSLSIRNQNQSMSNLVTFHQTSKAIALLSWPKMPHFHHFSICNQHQSISNLVISHQNTKVYSLTFRPNMPHFHHFSICNQNQSISNLVIFHQNTKAIALLFGQKMPHFHHFSICNQNQSISNLVIFHQTSKAISLLFGQTCLIFITFQSAIKINQFQIWSFFTKIPRL